MHLKKRFTPFSSLARLIFSMLFVVVLVLPMGFSLIHAKGAGVKTAPKPALPGSDFKVIFEPEYYQAWMQFANSRLTTDSKLPRLKSWIDYRLFAMTDAKEVHVGRDGWLFDRRSIQDYRKNGCQRQSELSQLITDLRTIAHLAEASGRRFIMTVVPNKSTIYPEQVGGVPREQACGKSIYELFIAEQMRHPLKGFVRLDDLLIDAKSKQPVYSSSSAYWNQYGAMVAANALRKAINPASQRQSASHDDLTEIVLGQKKPPNPQDHANAVLDPSKPLSTAVIYGGSALNRILPHIMPLFERLDVIASTTLPSLNHHEAMDSYETIIIAIAESRLLDLKIRVNQLCEMMEADALATTKREIKLDWVSGKNGVALSLEKGHLSIKSMGATALIEIPELPGSNIDAARIFRLQLDAPHNDTLTWSFSGSSLHGGTRKLHSGLQTLYLPLPREKSVQMRINSGRLAGIFKLHSAALLTLGRDAAAEGVSVQPPKSMEAVAKPRAKPHRPAVSSEVASPPSIVLNDFQPNRIFQRRGKVSDVFVSGSFRGRPTAIEAQVLQHHSNKIVVPWTVVDSTPTNGLFMGVVSGVPQGGWYRIAVRFQNKPEIFHRGAAPWGVGLLVACIGQSNMKEWFFAGGSDQADGLLSIHRNGRWESAEGVGNGAAAFGHHLIGRLKIPVGLLDYAVNGSGLRREADWGSGYWADRSGKGIYQKFIQGVTSAGGAVEYVVWMQGEADAARKTITQNQYGNSLKTLIEQQVRKDVGNGFSGDRLPFLIVGMVKRPVGQDEPHQAIRNALVAATRTIPDCYLAATTMDLKNLGRQHLDPAAYSELGLRVAQTVLYLLGKVDYYRGPYLDGLRKVTDTIIDVDLNHRGGNDIVPLFDITGFEVLRRKTLLAITQVQRHDPRTIRIHLAAPEQGRLTVRYLYGAMPDSAGAVRDNSTLRLPLEPFVAVVE